MAATSNHWYAPDGSPAYGATLRDARKDALVPSVTTIERVIAAPQLVRWQVEQALDAALTLPRIDGESLDAFKERARADSERQAKESAEKGSALHDALEHGLFGGKYPPEFERHVDAVAAALFTLSGNFDRPPGYHGRWKAEVSFAHPLGFGGKCDLHAPGIVVDFKSKPRIEAGKKYAYDSHCRQLAAYAVGLGLANAPIVQDDRVWGVPKAETIDGPVWCLDGANLTGLVSFQNVILANLFVGIEDAKVSVHIWKPEQAAKGWKQFRAALELWKALNNYYPAI